MEKSRQWAARHLIGVLGLAAVIMSIAAEFTRTKQGDVKYDYGGGCTLPQSPALYLGITAAISLFLAQITANIMGGCVCCSRRNGEVLSAPNLLIGITFLVLSWTSYVLAMLLLIAGSVLNQRQHQWLDSDCYLVKPGVFGGAALLSCTTTVFAIIHYAVAQGGETKNMDLPLHSSEAVVPVATPAFKAVSDVSSSSSALPVASVGFEPNPTKHQQQQQQSACVSGGHVELQF